ncbi:diguanylate cyclase [Desulfobacter hydrogenophilus]|uniref:Diguanylate cyclase n=1 Tax=Desulfobacter hydrogenophilus TaxID=2291 RepID=A0A328FB06_9BACT|nr:HDOD domain-containing protein [Desulfobacter hydrogenophilus]NDY72654.1 HDOD domain-containing protein [Desulfobacter hydrogenophilus]QBH14527.1 HDOD domain-containing protein [Desulfobacter hydrogenophilus]RAM01416.1 diguanylate cyclase [Desulfobacter hydrogenophilus]
MTDKLNLPSESDIQAVLTLDRDTVPSFPQVAAKLLEVSKNDTASLEEVAKIVETDPGISIRVLELVNSAFYGLSRKVTTLLDAVVILGFDEIKKLALGMAIFEKIFKNGHTKEFNRLIFWRHSLAVAVLSMKIAQRIEYPNPEEAYTAGLLHDVGKIFLDLQGHQSYGEFIKNLSESTDLVIEKERSEIGIGHDDIGAFFCTRWQLPENLVLAVKYHHQSFENHGLAEEEKQLIAIVSMADFLCWTQGMGSFDFIRPPILAPEVEACVNPKKIDIITCILEMNKEIEQISAFYKFVFPSIDQLKENLLWANIKLSRANTKYYYQGDPTSRIQDTHLSHGDILPPDIGFEMGKSLSKAKTVKEVLDIVLYQVGCVFQPCHWSILLKDPKTGDMVFSVVIGTNSKRLQGVRLPKGEGIAGYVMKTGKPLVVDDVTTDERFSNRVDKHTRFNTRSIIATPLKTDNKIFGVIELVNRVNEETFSEHDLNLLTSIAEYAGIAIERSYYHQTLTNIATRDSLTGLKNRFSFERIVAGANDFQARFGRIFSILILVVNGLTRQYEALGKEKCDEAVKKLATLLNKTKRREDLIFRYANNSFIALLPLTYSDGAQKAQARIKKTLTVATKDDKQKFSSISIQTYTMAGEDAGQLKKLVAQALSKTRQPDQESEVADMQENIQGLVEKEIARKDAEDVKGTSPEQIKKETIKNFGKSVYLQGQFKRLKTGEFGKVRVEQVSLSAIGFRISKSHRIHVNDFLDIEFNLDDIKRALIKRRVAVRNIQGNYIYGEYYNPPPYAKNLGFYIFS